MKTLLPLTTVLLLLGLAAGCDSGPKSGRGFKFPEGDSARGQAAFVRLECYTCHRVSSVTSLPAPTVAPEKVVVLGGEVFRLRSYGDLVTAVIHPSSSLSDKFTGPPRQEAASAGKSPMPVMNEKMTVAEMLDIVTFLHPHYKELEPLYTSAYYP